MWEGVRAIRGMKVDKSCGRLVGGPDFLCWLIFFVRGALLRLSLLGVVLTLVGDGRCDEFCECFGEDREGF